MNCLLPTYFDLLICPGRLQIELHGLGWVVAVGGKEENPRTAHLPAGTSSTVATELENFSNYVAEAVQDTRAYRGAEGRQQGKI